MCVCMHFDSVQVACQIYWHFLVFEHTIPLSYAYHWQLRRWRGKEFESPGEARHEVFGTYTQIE